ncbi:hypothetical protein [Ancrocorticia sp.]|uniref:hypothetical protein n=1 Tax=Ancrocorticia sp. TaxID=2593684 RepID=UPI003F8FE6E9
MDLQDVKSTSAGDYALLLENMGGGHRMDGSGEGRLVLLGSGGKEAVQSVGFDPIDQAALLSHGKELFWVGNDGLHIWNDSLRSYPGMPVAGSLYELHRTDSGYLAAINGGAPSADSYVSGLVLLEDEKKREWTYPGWLHSIAWAAGTVVGFASPTLDDPMITLTDLGPGNTGRALGDAIDSSLVWGQLISDGNRVMIFTTRSMSGATAELLITDIVSGSTARHPLTGAGSFFDVANWYEGSGPSNLLLHEGHILWITDNTLWRTDPASGETQRAFDVMDNVSVPGVAHYLSANGLLTVWRTEARWNLEKRSLSSGEVIDAIRGITVEGPEDLYVMGAVSLG